MTIGKKMGFGFGVLLALVATLAVVSLCQTAKMHRQFSSVIRYDAPVITNARHLLKLVVDMETGQRGFLITGKDEFLEPYHKAVASFGGLLREERALVIDHPEQVQLLNDIEQAVQDWQEQAAMPEIAMRRRVSEARVDAFRIQEVLLQGAGKRLMDEIMAIGHEIELSFSSRGDWEGAYLVELIEKCMADRESGQRGFLITGDSAFLEKYRNGEQKNLAKHFTKLRRLVSEDANAVDVLAKVDQLECLAAEWTGTVAEPEIAARMIMNEHPLSPRDVAVLLKRGKGKEILDGIRSDFGRLIQNADEMAARRFASASQDADATRTTTILLALASLVLGGTIATKITRGITSPVRTLADALGMVAKGEVARQIEVTTKDEIGELARSFNRMVGDLSQLEEERRCEIAARRKREIELRDSETRSRTLLEGAPVCNKIIGLDSRLQYMSSAGVTQLKISDVSQYYGKIYPAELYPEEMRTPLVNHLNRALAGETCSVECPLLDADGCKLWYHTTFVPARNDGGQIEYIIATSVNITARKRMEDDLRLAKETAEAATRVKSEFLANMSHEIRTPMTAIVGFAENLLSYDMSEAEKFNCVQTIRRNGEHLLGVVNDILDLSKIEAGKMSVCNTDCEPCRIVAEVLALMRVRADAKSLPLDVEYVRAIPMTIQSDPTRLRQILINLIGNAIKFTEEGSVRLVIRSEVAESRLQFDVIDTGCGMTVDQVAKLFVPFEQADSSTTREFGGTGLGLSISKRFAELLGGDITVVSFERGVGTTFRVSVPTGPLDGVPLIDDPMLATVVADIGTGAPCAESVNLLGLRILLAEDGQDNQRLISHVLRKAGANVTITENGSDAVEAAVAVMDGEHPYDAILTDMQMPVMDGYRAVGLLRERGYKGPVIALTAHAMDGDHERCIKAGCDEYLPKPIDRAKLVATIRRSIDGVKELATCSASVAP